jgi:hypothetical protein
MKTTQTENFSQTAQSLMPIASMAAVTSTGIILCRGATQLSQEYALLRVAGNESTE